MARGFRWAVVGLVFALLAGALLTAPAVLAGSEADPEIEDPKGDTDSAGRDPGEDRADLIRAYFEPVNETAFRVVAVVKGWSGDYDCDRDIPRCAWAVGWRWRGEIYGAYFWTYRQEQGTLEQISGDPTYSSTFRVGERTEELGGEEFPYAAIREVDGEVERGSPARISITVPVDILAGAEPGDRLNRTFAEVLDEDSSRYLRNDRGPDCETGDATTNEERCRAFGDAFTLPGADETEGSDDETNGTAGGTGNETSYAGSGNESANQTRGNATPAGEDGEALSPSSVETSGNDGVFSGGLWLVAVVGGVGLAGAGTVWWRAQGREWVQRAREVPSKYADDPAEGHRILDRIEERARSAREGGSLSSTGLHRLDRAIGQARAQLPERSGTLSGSVGLMVPSLEGSRYRVQRELPSGAFGRAWVAEDTKLGREVVVKRLHSRWTRDERVRRAFRREAEILIQTTHPHLVTVHDLDSEDGEVSIVMEYVEGGSLEDRLEEGPLPVDQVLRIAAEILDGLAHVHDKGIYHRDLKPANILLTSDGHAKVADFGTAHVAQATTPGLSAAGIQPGTPLYMAPEQVRGEDPDARTDLYALAALIHRSLTGEHYLGEEPTNPADLARAILEREPRLSPDLPGPLRELVARGLAKDREERFASAAEMKRAVEHLPGRLG